MLPDNMLIAIASDDALHLGVLSSAVHVTRALSAGRTLEDRPRYNKTRCFEPFPFPADDTGLTPALTTRIRHLAEQIDAHRKARQAVQAEVTLTGLYNLLEKLRRSEPLTAKDVVMHEQGLVGVLKSLHDELDGAVLQSYGWADLTLPADTDELLVRLVALNAQRAAEEAAGTVRWLRPEFQRSRGEQTQIETDDAADDEANSADAKQAATTPNKALPARPWPAGLTEQIKAVAEVMAQVGGSLDLDELAAHFSGRGRWRDRLPTLLDTLVALGRLRLNADGRWMDVGR